MVSGASGPARSQKAQSWKGPNTIGTRERAWQKRRKTGRDMQRRTRRSVSTLGGAAPDAIIGRAAADRAERVPTMGIDLIPSENPHLRLQIFVLMPHARSAHHPPEPSNSTPGRTENWKETIAAISKTTPARPRTIRPLVSMLREKYLFVAFGVNSFISGIRIRRVSPDRWLRDGDRTVRKRAIDEGIRSWSLRRQYRDS